MTKISIVQACKLLWCFMPTSHCQSWNYKTVEFHHIRWCELKWWQSETLCSEASQLFISSSLESSQIQLTHWCRHDKNSTVSLHWHLQCELGISKKHRLKTAIKKIKTHTTVLQPSWILFRTTGWAETKKVKLDILSEYKPPPNTTWHN